MPDLDYGANFRESNVDNVIAQSWDMPLSAFQTIRTLLNTTGLSYTNVQQNGLRVTNMRSHSTAVGPRFKVRNISGGTLVPGNLVYLTTPYTDGTDTYPSIEKALAASDATLRYAQAVVVEDNISHNADGTVALAGEVRSLNTSGKAVGDKVYLDTSAGGYSYSLPASPIKVQVCGFVTYVHVSAGAILFGNWSLVPWSIADQV